YTWWVYELEEMNYIQFGITDKQITTIFATGNSLSAEPFQIGRDYEELLDEFSFPDKITYQKGISFYSFLLNDDDLKTHPLLQVADDGFVQLYFDTISSQLSSIRIATGDVLLRQRFYEMEYRGNLPADIDLTD